MSVEKKLHTKHCRERVEAKALLVLLMRSLCNLKCSKICRVLGNVTQGRVSRLSSIGIKLLDDCSHKATLSLFTHTANGTMELCNSTLV